jgi:hypothetical protein
LSCTALTVAAVEMLLTGIAMDVLLSLCLLPPGRCTPGRAEP